MNKSLTVSAVIGMSLFAVLGVMVATTPRENLPENWTLLNGVVGRDYNISSRRIKSGECELPTCVTVDPTCAVDGNGSSGPCAIVPGGVGPRNSLKNALKESDKDETPATK